MIRLALREDLDEIMKIIASAKHYMETHGNGDQWNYGYPAPEDILKDIEKEVFYVGIVEGKYEFCFAYLFGDDPTYRYIEGKWLNEEPYGTIHRIASHGHLHGAFNLALSFCKEEALKKGIHNIRIDTKDENQKMLSKIKEAGFTYTGVIYVRNHLARRAFQLTF